ncbi:MAG: winged helix-turn-helix transcriptional regulator [Rudaea sp.]|uniref:MarR family winged helix-turn-helix transcriptional regulator n=1 Tax=Rudaea sp. 3F27F6 TaxID=2502208 RepID=UPI0010F827C6|nr:MarR family winged helix-turn-helix transcriptional regulator [Rudaea sp. 3F27F6]MBQ3301129.1 winged helix-turn-helix transcriptional regulator [Eggerthellaceae bacterium]MBR0346007.1 winged helix-turn-helix transcriptional regulator [Rudaea sp.]
MPATRTKLPARTPAAARDDAKPIGFLLQRAHNLLRTQLQDVVGGYELHLGHIAIMGALANGSQRTQRELSEWTGIEKSSMVIFLDNLEKQGWIRRERHPTDRRAHAVGLTAVGAERLASIGPRLTGVEEQFLSVLAPKQRKELANLLKILIAAQSGS